MQENQLSEQSVGRLAVLGVGVMGSAIARGLVASGVLDAAQLVLFDTDPAKAQALRDQLGGRPHVVATPEAGVLAADIILVAVKPGIVPDVLSMIGRTATSDHLVVSIAAGVRLKKMEALLVGGVPVIRAMPNTPALVNAGATAVSRGAHAGDQHVAIALKLFRAIGTVVEVDESLMDAVTGLSGSGPAYVFLMIEALADGGVKAGLPRATAQTLAAQTVFGAAKMALESELHPAQLKDKVTTPGGTTIHGLAALEKAGLRSALIDAVEAAATRSKELG